MNTGPAPTDSARAMLEGRYLRRDADGRVTGTAADLFDEVGMFVARAEDRYAPGSSPYWGHRFAATMQRLEFLPNSPTLMNAGTRLGVLSGCFVLPLEDSLPSIFDTLKQTALLHQAGAGTGFAFGHLRPADDKVESTGGTAGGPLSFLRLFDTAVDVVERSGRRRGACLGSLDVSHPDILEFVAAKAANPGALSHFALSVAVPDSFLEAVVSGDDHALVNPRTGEIVDRVSAATVFDAICDAAHRCGDPGLLFVDAVNRAHPLLDRIETTNPCGEVPLLPYESCNLGSVNLAACVHDRSIDWELLTDTVRTGVRFLDDVIDVSRYPFDELDRAARRTRKIGLGMMGLAELLAKLGIPYDSDRAVELTEDLARHIEQTAHATSTELAAVRGTYPAAAQTSDAAARKRRNLQVTSVAPTGSISLLAGTSAGIEPFLSIGGRRRILGREVVEIERAFAAAVRGRGCFDDVADSVLETGSVRTNRHVPADLRAAFPIAVEVAPEWHVRMQTAVQRHVDAAVSKTVLLPASAPVHVVREVYLAAWHAGAKGITVFRAGSVGATPDRARDDHVACTSCT